MKTAIEIVQEAYKKVKRGAIICPNKLRWVFRDMRKYDGPWSRWEYRQDDIGDHEYARGRDEARAYRQSDFTLARQLDREAARA